MQLCIFSPRALACIKTELKLHTQNESGGVFLGYRKNNIWHIKEVVFSGPDAIHKSAEFVYDRKYTEYQSNMLSDTYKKPLYVLGLWHSHITSSTFSYSDEETNSKFAKLNRFGAISCLIDTQKKSICVYHITPQGNYSKVYLIIRKSSVFPY
ncbi:MAG: Mov34/MPN/PAD-1 family protein [Clostridia bacterium]|nr:Mov34/MPN/PAD-1 family protein [Clostridia bacterium]